MPAGSQLDGLVESSGGSVKDIGNSEALWRSKTSLLAPRSSRARLAKATKRAKGGMPTLGMKSALKTSTSIEVKTAESMTSSRPLATLDLVRVRVNVRVRVGVRVRVVRVRVRITVREG
eukprot:scaffold27932_cov56-Phaeocystis_antarctica.AAC.2